MRARWLGALAAFAAVGCGDPFPPLDNDPVPLDDTTPDDTAVTPPPPPEDTAPTGDTGDGKVPEPDPPRPNDITFSIDLQRIEMLKQGCDGGTNGPRAEVYWDLQVGDENGFPLFLSIGPSNAIDMYDASDERWAPHELEADPVELRLNEDGTDSIFIIGQIWEDDTLSRDLIGAIDVVFSDPAEVDTGTITYTREGPTENEPDKRCSVSLIVDIQQVDPPTK